jgi:hypothetical protein
MTENSAISAFGLTSVRPDNVRERVGGDPGLRRTPKSRKLGLNRWPYGECRLMKSRPLFVIGPALAIALSVVPAQAKGCLKGALVGGVAGHYAGHHAAAGAIGGCIVGHHMAKVAAEKKRQDAAAAAHSPPAQPAQ